MTMTYAARHFTRMYTGPLTAGMSDARILSVRADAATVVEGGLTSYRVKRVGGLSGGCSVTWTAVSEGGSADLSGTVTGTVSFEPNESGEKTFDVQTVNRSGSQGDRDVVVVLSTPVSAEIDPSFAVARTTIRDYIPPSIDAYNYVNRPAGTILPSSDANILVWNIPEAGGTCPYVGNGSQVLLMVGPSGKSIKGLIRFMALRFKYVFLIGATFATPGSSKSSSNGNEHLGSHLMQNSFENMGGVRPTLFFANIKYDARDCSPVNRWGDFLRFGTKLVGTKSNPATYNYDEWVTLYYQKISVPFGHYGWTDERPGAPGHPSDDKEAHSDFSQPAAGGFFEAYIADVDVAWGYQTFFLQGSYSVDDHACPDGRVKLENVMMRPLPDNTSIFGSGNRAIAYNTTVGAGASQVPLGDYYSVWFKNVYAARNPKNTSLGKAYFSPTSTPAGNPSWSGNRLSFPKYTAPTRNRWPIWVGASGPTGPNAFVDFIEPPSPMVTSGETGYSLSIATKAQLRAIFG